MRVLRRAAASALILLVACNAMTGADALRAEEAAADAPINEAANPAVDAPAAAAKAQQTSADRRAADASSTDPDASVPVTPDDAPDASVQTAAVTDSFARADGPTLGNGWLEKTDIFSLAAGTATQNVIGDYIDTFVHRAPTSNAADVEVSVDFAYNDDFGCDATLYARIQPDSSQPGVLSGYTFYAYPDFAGIEREEGDASSEVASVDIAQPLVAGAAYRFLLRVRGTSPVTLEASITSKAGKVVSSITTTDSAPQRIVKGGQVGFGSSDCEKSHWDNFSWK